MSRLLESPGKWGEGWSLGIAVPKGLIELVTAQIAYCAALVCTLSNTATNLKYLSPSVKRRGLNWIPHQVDMKKLGIWV